MNLDRSDLLLYAVTDRGLLRGQTLREQVERSIKGGATIIQLREKELDDESFYREAVEIGELCRSYGVPFVVNDNVEVAIRSDADGIHVGQSDMDARRVRERIGADKILGVSAQTVEQAIRAQESGADYLGVGAVFPTGSKADASEVSFKTLKDICEAVSIPAVAIGGINVGNILTLKGSGVCGAAVISAIYGQEDVEGAAKRLKELAWEMIS